MPTALIDLPVNVEPRRKRWTRAECEELMASGVPGLERLELIDGELIDMSKKRRHVISLARLVEWVTAVFGARYMYQEAPIDVLPEDNPTSEPQPDIVVLKRDLSRLVNANPGPADLHLVIEISDSSLGFDLTKKAGLYARAAIVEYWVLDIERRRLIVHREPRDGHYRSVSAYNESESVAPLAAPASPFRVRDAFPE